MKIYRGPMTSAKVRKTDSQPLSKELHDWQPGEIITFDSTLDKSGMRHSRVGIEFEQNDIVALNNALMRHKSNRIKELEGEVKELKAEIKTLNNDIEVLDNVLCKLNTLTSDPDSYAPSHDTLIKAVANITNHFWLNRDQPLKTTKMRWLKWKTM